MSIPSWIDCCPEQGIEGYTERSDERRQVFEDVATRLDTEVSPWIWAFLQVADLEHVRWITASNFAWNAMKEGGLTYSSWVKDTLRFWKQRIEEKETEDTTRAPKRTHSEAFSDNASYASSKSQTHRSQIPTSETRTWSVKPLGPPEDSVRPDE